MLLANCLLLLVNIVGCAGLENPVSFNISPNMADKMCPAEEVGFQTSANNVMASARLCSETSSCMSFIYAGGNHICFGARSEFPFSSFFPLAGAVFYQPSTASATVATSATTATSTETSTPITTTMRLPACASTAFLVSGLAKNKFTSSSKQNNSLSADNAYLSHSSCWSADYTLTTEQWIQVDIGSLKLVKAVQTKGNPNADEWVTSYTLSYSTDCIAFQTVLDGNGQTRIFFGNYDNGTVVSNVVNPPSEGMCYRLNPITFHNRISLRFELIHCNL